MIIVHDGVRYSHIADITPRHYEIRVSPETYTDVNDTLPNGHSTRYRFSRYLNIPNIENGRYSVLVKRAYSPADKDNILGVTYFYSVLIQCPGCNTNFLLEFCPRNDNTCATTYTRKLIGFPTEEEEDFNSLVSRLLDRFTTQISALISSGGMFRPMTGTLVCNSCYDSCSTCDSCSEIVQSHYLMQGDCQSCIHYRNEECDEYDDECPVSGSVIHDYGYMPYLIFQCLDKERCDPYAVPRSFPEWQDPRYFAFEVEAGTHESWSDLEEHAVRLMGDTKGLYLKTDSSISPNGFEIVSHPFTFPFLRDNIDRLITPIGNLQNEGFTSYNNKSCGMHIHVSKDSVGNLQIFKLLRLLYEYPDFTLAISRRRNLKNMQEWAGVGDPNHKTQSKREIYNIRKGKIKYATDKYQPERYNAINLTNDDTIEFRIFRGTLKPSSIIMNLEIVKSLLDYTDPVTTSKTKVSPKNWREFVESQKSEYPNIIKTLFNSSLFEERFAEITPYPTIEIQEPEIRRVMDDQSSNPVWIEYLNRSVEHMHMGVDLSEETDEGVSF